MRAFVLLLLLLIFEELLLVFTLFIRPFFFNIKSTALFSKSISLFIFHYINSEIWDRLCGVYRDDLRSVQHTLEIISAVCITLWIWSLYTPQRRSQRCATHRGDDLGGVQHTGEIISEVCNTARRWSWLCAAYPGDKLHTAESSNSSLGYGGF